MSSVTVESPTQKVTKIAGRINYAPSTLTSILDSTSQREVSTRIEIKLSRGQLHEVQWLFTQYGLAKPTWLRGKFLLNQYRRKCINDNLREAQLDRVFCGKCTHTDKWWDLLHSVWHDINQEPVCL